MSLLRELEQRLESLLEGFFTRQFKSGVQPVEIAKKLAREMDLNRTISVSKVYVPNHYTVLLSDADIQKLKPFEKTLATELQSFLISHARSENYGLVGGLQIEFKSSPRLTLGGISIRSSLDSDVEQFPDEKAGTQQASAIERTHVQASGVKPKVTKASFLIMPGQGGENRFSLAERPVSIGRAGDNHIVVPDANVSRYHAKIELVGSDYLVKDLGSTNGTLVNGIRIGEHRLKHGDTITVGTTKIYFRREAIV